jgi:cation transport ATPase
VKLRLPGRRDRTEAAPDPADDLTAQLVKSAGKGRPTPKRNEAQGRRPGPPPPPPTTRKEAYRRQREQQAATRGATRAAAARGDDSYLPVRDRGPVRKLVRDIVDARRNAGSFFLLVAGLVLIGYFVPSPQFQSYTVSIWLAFFLLIIVDSIFLGRRIKKTVLQRFPGQDHKMRSLVWYGVTRATMVRRWRFPKPEVALGAQV